MRVEHLAVVHLVQLVARQDQHLAAAMAVEVARALAHGVGGALEPLGAVLGLLGREHRDEGRAEHVELVRHRQVLVEALGVVLRQHEDAPQVRVDAVADRDVDQPVLAADRHGRLRALVREREQARPAAAPEDDGEALVHAPAFCHAGSRGCQGAGGSASLAGAWTTPRARSRKPDRACCDAPRPAPGTCRPASCSSRATRGCGRSRHCPRSPPSCSSRSSGCWGCCWHRECRPWSCPSRGAIPSGSRCRRACCCGSRRSALRRSSVSGSPSRWPHRCSSSCRAAWRRAHADSRRTRLPDSRSRWVSRCAGRCISCSRRRFCSCWASSRSSGRFSR